MKVNDVSAEKMSPFACDMSAIEPDRRDEHMLTINQLFRTVEDVRELPSRILDVTFIDETLQAICDNDQG